MTVDELKSLMSAVAASDRRTIGKADVDFWAAMAQEGRWTLGTAMRALIQFRVNRPGDWLEPGHIGAIIREARKKAAATFVDPDVPEEMTGREYPAWYRAKRDAHVAEVLEAWAAGEPIPEPSAALQVNRGEVRELTTGINLGTCPPELRDQITRTAPRIGRRIPRDEAS